MVQCLLSQRADMNQVRLFDMLADCFEFFWDDRWPQPGAKITLYRIAGFA